MEDFSFATVPFDQAEKVVRTLNKLSHGRPIAEISKDSLRPAHPAEDNPTAAGGPTPDPDAKPAGNPKAGEILSPRLLRAGGFSVRPTIGTDIGNPSAAQKRPARKPGRNPQQPSKRAAKRTHRRKPLRRELPNSPKTGSKSGSASDNPPATKKAEPDPEAKKQRLNIKPAPRPRRVVRPQEIWRS